MYNKSLFLRIVAVILGIVGPPTALFTGGFSKQLAIVAVASVVLALPVYFIISFFGDRVGNFLFGFGQKPNLKEQTAGDIQKARYLLNQGKFNEAQEAIDTVLLMDATSEEALLLKAKIAIASDQVEEAKQSLKSILNLDNADAAHRRWARSMLTDIKSNPVQ